MSAIFAKDICHRHLTGSEILLWYLDMQQIQLLQNYVPKIVKVVTCKNLGENKSNQVQRNWEKVIKQVSKLFDEEICINR